MTRHPATRRSATVRLLALVLVATVFVVPRPSDDAVHAAPPEQRVTLFTDSVGLGAQFALPRAFPAGWDVNTRGEPALFTHKALQRQIIPNRHLLGDHVVMAVGYNFEYWDHGKFDRAVDEIIAYLKSQGVEHIYWVTLREVKRQYISQGAWNQIQPYSWYFPTVNERLRAAAQRHPDLTLVDWAANADRSGITYDAIHLNTAGAELYSRLIREAVDSVGVREFTLWGGGPLGPVSVVGDSVLRGSGSSLGGVLVEEGWGPVRFRADGKLEAGAAESVADAAWWVRSWRGGGWDAPVVLVNVGVNDVGACRTDAACARARIVGLLDEIGPGKRVWWPQVTHPEAGWAAVWNSVLVEVAGEREGVFTWDWPAELAAGGYSSPDGVHLDAAGYARRSRVVGEAFTHDVTRSVRVGGDAVLPVPSVGAGTYVPLVPQRVVNTRTGGPVADGGEVRVELDGRVPVGATAVAVSVTATQAQQAGFLSVGPCGRRVGSSTVNFAAGVDRAAMAVVPLGDGGDVCVWNSGVTHVLVDLQGVFVAGDGGSRLTPLGRQERIHNTRVSGRAAELVIDLAGKVPVGTTAVAVNLTVDQAVGAGFVTAVPCGASASVSSVNFQAGEAVAGAAFVAVPAQGAVSAGKICVSSSVSADVLVDLTGTFGPDGLSFVPVTPTRMLDTRNRIGGWAPIHGDGQTLDVLVAPPGAAAVTGTITEVGPVRAGYLTAFACPTRPPTSAVNAGRGMVLANSLTTAVSPEGRLCIWADPTTHTLFDVTGWWTP